MPDPIAIALVVILLITIAVCLGWMIYELVMAVLRLIDGPT